MIEDVENRKRTERRKTRASFKRENAIAGIRAAHALSLRVPSEPEVISEFLVTASGLDVLWAQFESEDTVILDCLIALDQSSEYSSALTTEVRAALNAAKAAATRLLPTHGSPAHLPSVVTHSCSLPGISLPLFKGDLVEWPVFRDRFAVLIGDHPDLCKKERFCYLLGCLAGRALDAIKNIPVSDDTYDLAWSTLTEHFDKPRRLATIIIDKLIAAPVQSQESLDGLKDFLSVFTDHVSILESLDVPSLGDFLLFTLAFRCLPWSTRKGFEASNTTEFPVFSEVVAYVKARVSLLETTACSSNPKQPTHEQPKASVLRCNLKNPKEIAGVAVARPEKPSAEKCLFCPGNHLSANCSKFIQMSLDERYAAVQKFKLCFRCLSFTHRCLQCNVVNSCMKCSGSHHTLLHREVVPALPSSVTSAAYLVSSTSTTTVVLLGTALVRVRDRAGGMQPVRALLDSGSQISAMTASCVDRLGLERSKYTAPLIGLSGVLISSVSGSVDCLVTPRYADDPSIHLQARIMSKIVADMPSHNLPTNLKDKFSHLVLADPHFDRSAPVDLLLGADAFSHIIDGKRVSVEDSLPIAYGSIFGWILIGAVSNKEYQSHTAVSLRFSQIEEPEDAPTTFTEGGQCESIYAREHYRDTSGQFEVPSPFIPQFRNETLSGLCQIAVRQLQYSERKLQNYEQLYTAYKKFTGEYELLEHTSATSVPGTYFILHHQDLKFNCQPNKILVVVDDFAKLSSEMSQSQCLFSGPKLQLYIVDIPTRYRIHQFDLTADVYKMYRQIIVIPKFRRFQHILRWSSPLDMLKECQIYTTIYRVNSAPSLALRVLKDIVEHECVKVFAVRTGLPRQTYVDDFYLDADSVKNLLALQSNLCIHFNHADQVLKMCFYVWSTENPADSASRRLLPSELELVGHSVHWFGSAFSLMSWHVPDSSIPVGQFLGIKQTSLAVYLSPDTEWYSRISSYLNTTNVAAGIRRFENFSQNQSYGNSFLSRELLDESLMVARLLQSYRFPESMPNLPHDYVGPQKSLRSLIKWRWSCKRIRCTNIYVIRPQGVNSSGR